MSGSAGPERHGTVARDCVERRSVILCYHRVADPESDPFAMCVSRRNFAEQMEVLSRMSAPISLAQLARGVRQGSAPSRSAVVTFDDGYRDNLTNALPVLDRFGVPATVFVATGPSKELREFWWDQLQRVFLEPGTLPEQLELRVGGSVHRWDLGEDARYDRDQSLRHRSWRNWDEPPTGRQSVFAEVYWLLRPLIESERREAMDELAEWAGCPVEPREEHRTLTTAEMDSMVRGGLIDIGAHTVTHPLLTDHPAAFQREEVLSSREFLEEALGRGVETFAYPYGLRSAETVEIVREAGFGCACSTEPRPVTPGSDPYDMPRFAIEDWDGDELGRRLASWFDAGKETVQ